MALTSTIHNLAIELADIDRGVYETLALKVARHPSESEEYFVTRVLAYCLEYTEGLTFSRGLSNPDDPALTVKDLTGALQAWIEIGTPTADRLHKASKAAPRVAVYMHKVPGPYVRQLASERIHRVEALEIYAIDRELLTGLAARIERRMTFGLSVNERHLYLSMDGTTLDGVVQRIPVVG